MESIINRETIILTFCILALCSLVRWFVEAVAPSLSKSTPTTIGQRIWELFILKSLPIVIGGLLCGLVKDFPYPEAMTSVTARVIYGVFCGFTSQWTYDIGRAVIYKKWNTDTSTPAPTSNDPGASS